jgi:hypothetical protein
MPSPPTFTIEHQTIGLKWARRLGRWLGYAVMLLGIPLVLQVPKVSESGPLLAVFLWLLWSGAFALTLSFALPEVYIRLHGRIRHAGVSVEVSPEGLRIGEIGLLAWHRFEVYAEARPDRLLVIRQDKPWLKIAGPSCPELLAELGRQYPPRQLPAVSPEGYLLEMDEEAFASGTILSQRHGGTDLLYGFSADEGLAACAAQGSRILLGYSAQTFADRRATAVASALAMLILASIPALGLGALFGRDGGLPVMIALTLGAALWGAWKEMTTPGKVWSRSEWIDLDTRTWNARRNFPDHSLPDQRVSLPLGDLLLVCFTQQWEQGVSYDVGLCKSSELKADKYGHPPCLNMLYCSDSPSDTSRFALALSNRWGIPCWQIEDGLSVRKRQLA